MIDSHLAPNKLFFRHASSESLGIALLFLRLSFSSDEKISMFVGVFIQSLAP